VAEPIQAGPFSALLADGALRDIRLLGYRALDGVYVAVRDRDWNTIPGTVTDFRYAPTPAGGGFTASWQCVHRGPGIEFGWHGSIAASPREITVRLAGEALSEFETNRIGFCFLHPIELTGTAIELVFPDGDRGTAVFPVRVSPGPILTGACGLAYEAGPGARLEIAFAGGRLETEDHRNWTDPGWKTYSPPLGDPAPWRMRPGDRVSQAVTLRASTVPGAVVPEVQALASTEAVSLRLGPADGVMPELGIVLDRQALNLSALAPTVLHVELTEGEDWRARLASAAERAACAGGKLSVAVTGTDPAWLAACGRALSEVDQPVAAVGVFAPPDGIAAIGAARLVRAQLAPGVMVGGGSRLHFAELNRAAERDPDWDFVMFPVTPQVHHADDDSVLCTVLGQEPAVRDASGGLPVIVGPVSLRRRTGQFTPASPDDPRDPRECEPLGVAWLCASVIAMHAAEIIIFRNPAAGGPATVSGPASGGEPATGGGSAPSPGGGLAAGDCGEVERVFARLAGLAGQSVRRVECDRRRVAALVVHQADGPPLLIVSNLTPHPVTVRLDQWSWPLRGYEAAVLDTCQLPAQLSTRGGKRAAGRENRDRDRRGGRHRLGSRAGLRGRGRDGRPYRPGPGRAVRTRRRPGRRRPALAGRRHGRGIGRGGCR
jgi:D-apionolactonase